MTIQYSKYNIGDKVCFLTKLKLYVGEIKAISYRESKGIKVKDNKEKSFISIIYTIHYSPQPKIPSRKLDLTIQENKVFSLKEQKEIDIFNEEVISIYAKENKIIEEIKRKSFEKITNKVNKLKQKKSESCKEEKEEKADGFGTKIMKMVQRL